MEGARHKTIWLTLPWRSTAKSVLTRFLKQAKTIRARRAADREAEEASNGEGQGTESAEDAEEAEKVAGKVTLLTVEVSDPPSSDVISADEAVDASKDQEGAAAEQADFPCHICDFRSTWANGLSIHMTRKHANIEQLDGSTSVSEDLEEDTNAKDYVTYQVQFDALECSDEQIKECFDFNFKDELKTRNVTKEDSEYEISDSKLVVKKYTDAIKSLKTFEIKIKNIDKVKEAIEVFQVVWEFDNLGFKGSEQFKKQATLMEFKIL